MLDTAGTSAVAASTGSKKATLQKLMSFDMMEPGYPMDEEMMLEVRQVAMAEQIKAPNFSKTDITGRWFKTCCCRNLLSFLLFIEFQIVAY